MSFFETSGILSWILNISGLLIALGVIARYIISPLYKFLLELIKYFKSINILVKETDLFSTKEIKSSIDSINKDLLIIKAEVTPNGGNSLKDTINQIKLMIKIQEFRQFNDSKEELRWESDSHGRFIKTSEGLRKLWGCSTEEMIGFGWQSKIHPDDREKIHSGWIYANENNIPWNAKYRIVNKETGITYNVLSTGIYLLDGNNEKIIYWLGDIKIL